MKKLKRTNVYLDTYKEVYGYAREQTHLYDARADNNKPLDQSFPASLQSYIEHLKKKNGSRKS